MDMGALCGPDCLRVGLFRFRRVTGQVARPIADRRSAGSAAGTLALVRSVAGAWHALDLVASIQNDYYFEIHPDLIDAFGMAMPAAGILAILDAGVYMIADTRQMLHDRLSGTYVIELDARSSTDT